MQQCEKYELNQQYVCMQKYIYTCAHLKIQGDWELTGSGVNAPIVLRPERGKTMRILNFE
jgi:hypothetical protein